MIKCHKCVSSSLIASVSQAPRCDSTNYDQMPYDHLRASCKRGGYHKKDAKAVLRARLAAMDAAERRVTAETERDMDTSSSVFGKRLRNTGEPLVSEPNEMGSNEGRPRGGALAIALVVDMSVVQEHAHCRNPAFKPKMAAPRSSVVECVDGSVSAWVADERNRISRQELSPEEEKLHADLV